MVIVTILSLAMPGLGHVFIGRFPRALIWFGGAMLVGAILRGGDVAPWAPAALFGALGVFAALDACMAVGAARDARER